MWITPLQLIQGAYILLTMLRSIRYPVCFRTLTSRVNMTMKLPKWQELHQAKKSTVCEVQNFVHHWIPAPIQEIIFMAILLATMQRNLLAPLPTTQHLNVSSPQRLLMNLNTMIVFLTLPEAEQFPWIRLTRPHAEVMR